MDRKLFVTPIVQVLEMMTMIELNETKFRSDFATKKTLLEWHCLFVTLV